MENIEDLTKIKSVQLKILWDECSDYQNQGIFDNLEDCMLHILMYEGAIMKRNVCNLLEKYKEFFSESNEN